MQIEAAVLRSWPLTPSIHAIAVQRPPDFQFAAGQHVMVEIETPAGGDDRFLSIASAPSDQSLDFAVRVSPSEFKQAFQRLRAGEQVRLIGPSGRFRRDPDRPAVLLSGGVGITPLRSMLRQAAHHERMPATVLVFGNREPREIPFREELDAMASRDNIQVFHTVESAGDSWGGSLGRIGPDLVLEASRSLHDPVFYLCGPPAMVEALATLLVELGVDRADILNEHFTGY